LGQEKEKPRLNALGFLSDGIKYPSILNREPYGRNLLERKREGGS